MISHRLPVDVVDRNFTTYNRDPHLVRLLEHAGTLDVALGAWLCPLNEQSGIGLPLAHAGRIPWAEIRRSIDAANGIPGLAAGIDAPLWLPDDNYVLCSVGDNTAGRAILFLRQRAWHPSIRAKLDEAIEKIRQLIHTVWIMRAEAVQDAIMQSNGGHDDDAMQDGTAATLAEQCPFGMMILDVDQYIHLANSAAHKLLGRCEVIGAVDNRLTISDSHDAIRFQVTLRAVFLGASEEQGRRTLAIMGPAGTPLLLTISKLSDGPAGPRACVIITQLSADTEPNIKPLAELFSLTPVETRLICQLLKGLNLQEAARALQLKVQTVRTYLKLIFQKTGTHRQVELVQLMQRGSLPVLD
ncbi:MAG: helix-turn-helix transcriptional regulator [Sphingobium sp.]